MNKTHYAGAHNYCLRRLCGASAHISGILNTAPSLTPEAEADLAAALTILNSAIKEMRKHRREPDGTIWTRKEPDQ